MLFRTFFFPVWLLTAASVTWAADTGAEAELGTSTEPLAIMGDLVLTQGEIDAAFDKVAPERRLLFIRDGKRVNLVIQNLLRSKALARQAREAGFDQTPVVQQRLKLAAEQELGEAWLRHVIAEAPKADYEALARETYLSDPAKWKAPVTVDVSHLLISSESRSDEEARALAEELRTRAVANPAQFDDLIMEYSEDPSKSTNSGRFQDVQRGQMVKPFEEMAFSMKQAGEISPLVKTSYGYHIIRLNGRKGGDTQSFEEVRDQLVAAERKKHLSEYGKHYLAQLSSTPIELPEGAVEAMAKRYFGEDLELAPQFDQ